jgi:hypothetical protein
MAGTEAKDLGNFIVEPLGTNINSPTSFIVRKKFQDVETTTTYSTSQVSTMFNDIMLEATRPTAHGSSNMKGGGVYLKNGTYLLDGTDGIQISDTTDDDNVSLRLIGESRDNVILKAGGITGTDRILQPFCSLGVENITFNGNSITDVYGIEPSASGTSSKIIKVKDCRFTNIEGFDILIGHNCTGVDVSECIFENHQNAEDNVAFECTGWARIYDNYFDRTAGTTTGSSLTSGTAFNVDIHDNIIKRVAGNIVHGISIETFDVNDNYENVFIHNNLVINGTIAYGSVGAYNRTIKNLVIDSNVLYGGDIRILGPDSGSFSTQVKEFNIENNKIYNPYYRGILVQKTAGIGFVRNNTVYNSNIALDVTTFDKGCIYLQDMKDMICENNSIYMGVKSPDDALFSPYGIRYQDSTNLTLRNNRIINRTTANSSYEASDSHTGSVLISRSL